MSKAIRITAVVSLLFLPAVVQAQDSLGGWRGLKTSSLETIYVTDDAGQQTEGKLLRFDPDSLVMLVNGVEHRVDRNRVLRIDKRGDSIKNGALIGAAVGVLFGVLAAGISDCPGNGSGDGCAGAKVAGFALSVGLYASVGAGIDAMIVGRTRVFDADRPVASRRTQYAPQLAFRVSW